MNNKGQPFLVKNSSMIQPYLGGCQTIREPMSLIRYGITLLHNNQCVMLL